MYYFRCPRIITLFLLSFLANLTCQVDIIITYSVPDPAPDLEVTCPDISPGICCRALAIGSLRDSTVTFRGLQALDVAAIWRVHRRSNDNVGPMRSIRGCSGIVMESRSGPGTWIWSGRIDIWSGRSGYIPPEGASFIKLPEALPLDPSWNKWLMAEGLLGLAWGGGNWFISEKAKRLLPGRNMKGKRDVRSKKKGNVWARSPMRECFPKWIDVNGTRYEDEGAEGKVYKDGNRQVLNTTAWFDG